MKKSLLRNIERIERKKAIGIFYNMPKDEAAILVNNLLDRKKAVHIRGKFADDKQSLKNRLGNYFQIKRFDYDMLPAAMEGRMLILSDADYIRPSYNYVIEKLSDYKIPMLLLMNHESALEKIRKFGMFNQVMTIEIDFNQL